MHSTLFSLFPTATPSLPPRSLTLKATTDTPSSSPPPQPSLHKLNKYSSIITEPKSRGGSQAVLYGVGLSDSDMSKPQIGISPVWYEGNTCNMHLLQLSEAVKEGVKEAGMVPFRFNTIGVSDAISQGTKGMRFSLQSRDLIADSIETVMSAHCCLAGESVHFFDEVHELSKIPEDDCVRRIYMARHIIEKYIVAGAAMEVNISHRSRQEIMTTSNLARPDLFHNALNEIVQLMKMNLAKDYWSSMFFLKFQEESDMRSIDHDLDQITGWNYSPRLSSVHSTDDPFHQEHLLKSSGCNDTDS